MVPKDLHLQTNPKTTQGSSLKLNFQSPSILSLYIQDRTTKKNVSPVNLTISSQCQTPSIIMSTVDQQK